MATPRNTHHRLAKQFESKLKINQQQRSKEVTLKQYFVVRLFGSKQKIVYELSLFV